MDRRRFWRKLTPKDIITIFSTLIASVAIVVYFLPHQNKFGYEYELGKPWHYAPLIAPYDFPVYKTEEAMATERDSVVRHFEPFYEYDAGVARQHIEALRKEFTSGKLRIYSQHYFDHLAHKLTEVYAAGVVSPEEYDKLTQNGGGDIRIISGNAAISK